MPKTCSFLFHILIHHYTTYDKLSVHVISCKKINILGANIKVNHLFQLLIPDNAPKTAHKIIQYANICKNRNIPK